MANAIKTASVIDDYLDNPRGARYFRIQYDNAVASAIRNIIDSIIPSDPTKPITVEIQQAASDNLYTLLKTQTAAPTTDIALYPADYRFFDSIYATIGGVQYWCRPTTPNKKGPMQDDSFRRATDIKPYYFQQLTGFKILHGIGTVTSVDLNYYKTPLVFSIGKDSQLISAGTAIVNASVYIAVDPSVQNSVSYNIGDQFTAVGTTLTSGTVILASNTVAIELPEKLHDKVAKLAAEILLGQTQQFNQSAFAEKEADKS